MPILPFPEDRLRCISNENAVELVDITANARLLDKFDHHERIVKGICPTTGLQAIIAIHDRRLGPALGGCRMWPYESEREAVIDAQRLSKSMTLKAAVAGLPLGGGKAVIIGDPQTLGTEALFRSFGRVVVRLGGQYITSKDVGT